MGPKKDLRKEEEKMNIFPFVEHCDIGSCHVMLKTPAPGIRKTTQRQSLQGFVRSLSTQVSSKVGAIHTLNYQVPVIVGRKFKFFSSAQGKEIRYTLKVFLSIIATYIF